MKFFRAGTWTGTGILTMALDEACYRDLVICPTPLEADLDLFNREKAVSDKWCDRLIAPDSEFQTSEQVEAAMDAEVAALATRALDWGPEEPPPPTVAD